MDVTQQFVDKLWIGPSRENGWSITVEYEGNNAFCKYCGLLGHTMGLCLRKRQVQGKSIIVEENKNTQNRPELKKKETQQWVAKGYGNGASSTSQTVAPKEKQRNNNINVIQQVTGILKRPTEHQSPANLEEEHPPLNNEADNTPKSGTRHRDDAQEGQYTVDQVGIGTHDKARSALVNAGLISDSEGATTDNIAPEHGRDNEQQTEPSVDNGTEPFSKTNQITTANQLEVLEEGDESLEVHSEPVHNGESENDKLAHSDTECLSPRKRTKRSQLRRKIPPTDRVTRNTAKSLAHLNQ